LRRAGLIEQRVVADGDEIHALVLFERCPHGPVGDDHADEIAAVAVEYDFIADLGTIAGLEEAASGRHGGILGSGVGGSRCRHERRDPFPVREGDGV
jgi:hypothetical protein